jgi:large subunit ribosomal protein L21
MIIMEYAIIEINGHQYRVKPGDSFAVNGTYAQAQLKDLIKVLAVKDETIKVGTPVLSTKLDFVVEDHAKSEKLHIKTYRSKSRYRRKIGHRQDQTVITLSVIKKTSPKSTPAKTGKSEPAAKTATKPGTKPEAKTVKSKLAAKSVVKTAANAAPQKTTPKKPAKKS